MLVKFFTLVSFCECCKTYNESVKNINAVLEIRRDEVQRQTMTCFVKQQEKYAVPGDGAVMRRNASD